MLSIPKTVLFFAAVGVATAASTANAPDPGGNELRPLIERYSADNVTLGRYFGTDFWSAGGGRTAASSSPQRRARMAKLYADWQARLDAVDFDKLSQPGKIDYLLFRNRLGREQRQLALSGKKLEETAPLLPFRPLILSLVDARRRMEPVDAAKAATQIAGIQKQVEALRLEISEQLKKDAKDRPAHLRRAVAYRAAKESEALRASLKAWFAFGSGYDPLFTWWMESPYKEADKALQDYAVYLKEKVVGVKGVRDMEVTS